MSGTFITINNSLTPAAIAKTIIDGNKAAKDLETAGGTPLGIFITNLGLPINLTKISVPINATINAINKPCAPKNVIGNAPSGVVEYKIIDAAVDTIPAASPSLS